MKILLIRHGQTEGNLKKRYIGCRSDQPLLEREVEKAGELGRFLREKLPAEYRLITSPMRRCLQTAEALTGKRHYEICPDLREIDFGDFEGRNYRELSGDPAYQAWIDSGGRAPFPEGESLEAFTDRSMGAFLKILNLHCRGESELLKEGTAASKLEKSERSTLAAGKLSDCIFLIVCHGGTVMSVMSSLTGRDYFDFAVPNLDGYYLEIKPQADGRGNLMSNGVSFNVLSYMRLRDWLSAGSADRGSPLDASPHQADREPDPLS